MNQVLCPHCGKNIEISEALKHQIEDDLKKQFNLKNKEEIEKIKKELEEKAIFRAKRELDIKLKDSENQNKEFEEENQKLKEQVLEASKLMRELKKQKDELELENEKKLNEERDKLKEDITKTVTEKARLKELELEKKLSDTQKALEDAQRKSQQGSGQLQGEVMELNLEEMLKKEFVYDEFLPIPKGVEGADIWQKVKNKHGQEAGSLLWEIKRTKAFSKGWLSKLRDDKRRVNASICVLVSEVLPDGINYFGREEGVWITSYNHAILLANVLRDTLLQLAIAKSAASHKDEKLQEIYDYITSEAFRHKIEAHFESVKALREDLEREKRAMESMWKKREVQIQRLDKSVSQMFGEIQGIAGASLPLVKSLELGDGSNSVQEEIT